LMEKRNVGGGNPRTPYYIQKKRLKGLKNTRGGKPARLFIVVITLDFLPGAGDRGCAIQRKSGDLS